jgi:hypothetical protein
MRGLRYSLLLLPLWTLPASAADVTFSGTLTGICTLALSTPGTLGLTAGGVLSSTAGLPAVLAILSIGTNTLTVNPPVWDSTPGGYTAGTEVAEVAYSGLSGLGIANQAFTSTVTTRSINTLPLSLLTMNAQISNSLGFAAGTYEMKVVVTCS